MLIENGAKAKAYNHIDDWYSIEGWKSVRALIWARKNKWTNKPALPSETGWTHIFVHEGKGRRSIKCHGNNPPKCNLAYFMPGNLTKRMLYPGYPPLSLYASTDKGYDGVTLDVQLYTFPWIENKNRDHKQDWEKGSRPRLRTRKNSRGSSDREMLLFLFLQLEYIGMLC